MTSEAKKAPHGHIRRHQGVVICLVGGNGFNSELLANFIQDQTGMTCHYRYPDHLKSSEYPSSVQTTVVLLDCTDLCHRDLWPTVKSCNPTNSDRCLLILDHIKPVWNIEHRALDMGVRGVFYDDQAINLYPKAIRAILDGELWYPRQVLEKHLLAEHPHPRINSNAVMSKLTRRERDVLHLLVSGFSNREIADQLCVSPHTVKSHVYNVYRKLNVTSRLQAAIWVSEVN